MVTASSNNYGPYQFPEKMVPMMVLAGIENSPMPIYGDGTNVRDWLHVADHADALWRVFREGRPGEKYNIGAGDERPNIEVVRHICAALDELAPDEAPHDRLIMFVPDRPAHDLRYAIDASKIVRHLGWKPMTAFEDGLRETVAWYRENRAWWQPLREGAYDGGRLGLGASSS